MGECDKVANETVQAIYNKFGTNFSFGSGSEALYYTTGTTKDYGYDMQGVGCSFTIELRDTGDYGFLLPEEQILPVAEEMYDGYMKIVDNVLQGYCDFEGYRPSDSGES